MFRLTNQDKEGVFFVAQCAIEKTSSGYGGQAITKLGKIEEMVDNIEKRQQVLSKELEQLRLENKTKTYHFKEKMAEKLNNQQVLKAFERVGIS